MKVTENNIENRQAFLTIEVEPAEVEKSLEESYQRLVRRTAIPGFRKGRAPRPILERHIGKERLFEDALNNLIPEAYQQAIKEQEIEAFTRPHIEITQNDPLVFKAIVPLAPAVTLGDYLSIKVAPEDKVQVTKSDISATIEQVRHQHATWEPVERPAEYNDLLIVDIDSHIDDSPFINRKGVQYQLLSDASFPAPGFAEKLIGMNRDEEKEFQLQFPADYSRSELAGKEPSFKVKLTEIKQEKLPELNDELAREVNPEFKDLKSLQEEVTKALRMERERKAKLDFEERVIEAVVDTAEVEFPPILVEVEIERLIDQQLRRWQMNRDNLENYLRMVNKTEPELREELQPIAAKRVAQSLVLGKIAEAEKIEADESEIDAEVERISQGETENREELQKYLNTPQSRESIRELLISRKTMERLVEIGKSSAAVKKKKSIPTKEVKND